MLLRKDLQLKDSLLQVFFLLSQKVIFFFFYEDNQISEK